MRNKLRCVDSGNPICATIAGWDLGGRGFSVGVCVLTLSVWAWRFVREGCGASGGGGRGGVLPQCGGCHALLFSKGAPYFVHAELVTDVEQAEVR